MINSACIICKENCIDFTNISIAIQYPFKENFVIHHMHKNHCSCNSTLLPVDGIRKPFSLNTHSNSKCKQNPENKHAEKRKQRGIYRKSDGRVLNQTMLNTRLTWENKLLSVLKVAGSFKKKREKE